MALAVPVFVLQVYDRVVAKAGLTTLQGLAAGVAVVIIFDFLLRQTRSRVVQRASLRFDLHFGKLLFEKLNRLPLRVLESRPAAYWQGLFRDSDTVRNAVAGPPVIMLVDLPFAVLFLGIIYIIAEPLVWVIIAAAAIFVLFALRSGFAIGSVANKERGHSLNRWFPGRHCRQPHHHQGAGAGAGNLSHVAGSPGRCHRRRNGPRPRH